MQVGSFRMNSIQLKLASVLFESSQTSHYITQTLHDIFFDFQFLTEENKQLVELKDILNSIF